MILREVPMAIDEEIEVMSEAEFTGTSKSHRRTLVAWFVGTFITMTITFGVKEWAYTMRGWEADIVYTVFYLTFALSAFGVLFFGVLLYGWFKEVKLAKRNRESYDRTHLHQIYRHVFGPIPWR